MTEFNEKRGKISVKSISVNNNIMHLLQYVVRALVTHSFNRR